MANRMTIEGFADLVDPTFREVMDTVEMGEDMIPRFYTVETPKLPTEKGTSIAGMGLWQEFTGTTTYDAPSQGYSWQSTYKEYAKGVQIERSLIEYDQFDVVRQRFEYLKTSLHDTRQAEAAQTLIQAFVVDSGYTTDEGVALCSDSHTSPVTGVSTSSGFDNLTTEALSPAALQRIRIQGAKFMQNHGQPYEGHSFNAIIGPVDLEQRAQEILQTATGLQSAEGTKNILQGAFQYIPWRRLTNTTNYYVVNLEMMKRCLIWFDKVKGEFSRVEDLDTKVAKYAGYAIWHRARKAEWRFLVGSQVS